MKVVIPKTKHFVPMKRMMLSINTFGRFYPIADTEAGAGIEFDFACSNGSALSKNYMHDYQKVSQIALFSI